MDKLDNGYCCLRLQLWVESQDCPFYYNPRNRDYGISAPKSFEAFF